MTCPFGPSGPTPLKPASSSSATSHGRRSLRPFGADPVEAKDFCADSGLGRWSLRPFGADPVEAFPQRSRHHKHVPRPFGPSGPTPLKRFACPWAVLRGASPFGPSGPTPLKPAWSFAACRVNSSLRPFGADPVEAGCFAFVKENGHRPFGPSGPTPLKRPAGSQRPPQRQAGVPSALRGRPR